MVEELNTLARVLELPCRAEGYYPGWPFEAESKMRELLTSCCQEILGKTPLAQLWKVNILLRKG